MGKAGEAADDPTRSNTEKLGLPKLQREERLELQQRIEQGAQADADYVVMMTLAAVLASLGLLQDSTAVIIGAMLVAPLMGPLVAAGLAITQGNELLFRKAAWSTAVGIGIGLGVSLLTGLINPGYEPSLEIEARGEPDVFDLEIAFASGMAAAYASVRPKIASTLAGVAIAAALVPPLAVIGIAVTNERMLIGAYATILLATNIVAIILGAGLIFLTSGVRAHLEGEPTRGWARRAIGALIFGGIILSAPLLMKVLEKRRAGQARPLNYPVAPHVRAAVQDYISQWPDFEVISMGRTSVEPDAGTNVVVLCDGALPTKVEVGLVATIREARGDEGLVVVFPVVSARARSDRADDPGGAD